MTSDERRREMRQMFSDAWGEYAVEKRAMDAAHEAIIKSGGFGHPLYDAAASGVLFAFGR